EEVYDLVERRAEGDKGLEAGERLAGDRRSLSAGRRRRGGAGRAERALEAEPVEGVVGDGRAQRVARQRHARVAGLPEQPPELPGRLVQDQLPAGEEARVVVCRGVERDVGGVVHEASLDDDGEQQEPPGQADLPEPPPLPEGVQPPRDKLARHPPALRSEPDLDEHPQQRRGAEEGEEQEIPSRRDLHGPSFLLRACLDPRPDHAPQRNRARAKRAEYATSSAAPTAPPTNSTAM